MNNVEQKQEPDDFPVTRLTEEAALRFAEYLFSHGKELGVWSKQLEHGKLFNTEF